MNNFFHIQDRRNGEFLQDTNNTTWGSSMKTARTFHGEDYAFAYVRNSGIAGYLDVTDSEGNVIDPE